MTLCVGSCPLGFFFSKACFPPCILGSCLLHHFGQEVTALWTSFCPCLQEFLKSFVFHPLSTPKELYKGAQLAPRYPGLLDEDGGGRGALCLTLYLFQTQTGIFAFSGQGCKMVSEKMWDLSCSFHGGCLGHLTPPPPRPPILGFP